MRQIETHLATVTIAANAIIAALSVHNHGSAFLNSNPFACACLAQLSPHSRLQLTPPLIVTRSNIVFLCRCNRFAHQHIDHSLLK